jgi:hypothetical protein
MGIWDIRLLFVVQIYSTCCLSPSLSLWASFLLSFAKLGISVSLFNLLTKKNFQDRKMSTWNQLLGDIPEDYMCCSAPCRTLLATLLVTHLLRTRAMEAADEERPLLHLQSHRQVLSSLSSSFTLMSDDCAIGEEIQSNIVPLSSPQRFTVSNPRLNSNCVLYCRM